MTAAVNLLPPQWGADFGAYGVDLLLIKLVEA